MANSKKNRKIGKKKKQKKEIWKQEFEDISSHSPGVTSTPAEEEWQRTFEENQRRAEEERKAKAEAKKAKKAKPAGGKKRPAKAEPEWSIPKWEAGAGGKPAKQQKPDKQQKPASRGTGPDSRPSGQKKEKAAPKNTGARKAMIIITVFIMAAATGLLAISLLFKVSKIYVTGDRIEGYAEEDILRTAGYKTGDNLFFLTTNREEDAIEEKYPYIGDARILRHFPGAIEIRLTAARTAACIARDDGWLYVSDAGRVLDKGSAPLPGVMQVFGLALSDLPPGRTIVLEEPEPPRNKENAKGEETPEMREYIEDMRLYNALNAFRDISEELGEMADPSVFTRLDLTDLSDIRIYYRDRVEFRLGSVIELPYKIGLGCRSMEKMEGEGMDPAETGVMDLSFADTTSKAVYTVGEIELPKAPVQDGLEQEEPAPAPETEPTPLPDSTRAEGIPEGVFTG